MSLKNTLRKHENKGIPNLYMVILICTLVGYVLRYLTPGIYYNLVLVPYMVVVNHQFWRLFTWIFTIPYELTIIMVIFLPINLYFYYSIGRRLEYYWGRLMYNMYVIGGFILTDIAVLIGAYYRYYWSPNAGANRALDITGTGDGLYAGLSVTRYMLISIFLAFAVVGGENIVYLYFVIPLKMRWLAYFDLILLLYIFLTGGYFTRIMVVCSVANYFIYYFVNRDSTKPAYSRLKRRRNTTQKPRKKSKKPEVEYNRDGTLRFPGSQIIPPGYGNPDSISIHKCAVCGRTEKDSPNLEFRFCSKCNGNYEYCSEHLFTHQHIK